MSQWRQFVLGTGGTGAKGARIDAPNTPRG